MARKRRAHEMLSRVVAISSVSARIGVGVDDPRDEEHATSAWLELRGHLEEPFRGVADVLISMYPQDKVHVGTPRPASVGSLIGLKPEMSVVLPWLHRDFDWLWALAVSGQIGFAHITFTKPHYGRALVVNASFSTEREE
jgi:hypothetical protein